MKSNILSFSLMALCLLFLSACSSDDGPGTEGPENPDAATEQFVIAGEAATAEQAKTYLFLADKLDEGEITVQGNGYETRGSTMFALNNKAFSFQYNRGDPGFTEVFQLNQKAKLEKVSSFSVKSVNVFLSYKDQEHLLAYNIGRALNTPGSAYWINTETNTVDKDAEFDQKIIYVDGKFIPNYYAFVYSFFEFGDKIYAVYNPRYGGEGEQDPYDYENRAFVSIFDQDMNFEKTISDNRMPFIGRYYNVMGLGQDDNGDIYAFSTGDVESDNNHAAFLRIENEEFDKDYYWDVEEVADGMRIHAGKHLGGDKFILAMVDRDEVKAESEGAKLAIVEAATKEFHWVSGIDDWIAPGTYAFPLFINNGKAYLPLSLEEASVTYLYAIDPDNYIATQGLKLTGIQNISGIGILSNETAE